MDALRKALAMGADRAVLITDEALAGSDLLGTAKALAGALEQEGADLILFGQQSADGDGACLWAAVAEYLRRPAISQVSELSVGDGTLTGKRQTEYGYDTIRAPLPAVVAVSDAINVPRYPSLKGIMGAKKKPQELKSAADVGGAVAPRTTVLALHPPPRARRGAPDRGQRVGGASRSSSSSPRSGSSDEGAGLLRAPRRRADARVRSACSRRRRRSAPRSRVSSSARVCAGSPTRPARTARRRLGRRRRASRGAAAAAARRRAREARARRGLRHGAVRAVGARGRRRGGSGRPARRGAQLGPGRPRRRRHRQAGGARRQRARRRRLGRRAAHRDLPLRRVRRGADRRQRRGEGRGRSSSRTSRRSPRWSSRRMPCSRGRRSRTPT